MFVSTATLRGAPCPKSLTSKNFVTARIFYGICIRSNNFEKRNLLFKLNSSVEVHCSAEPLNLKDSR